RRLCTAAAAQHRQDQSEAKIGIDLSDRAPDFAMLAKSFGWYSRHEDYRRRRSLSSRRFLAKVAWNAAVASSHSRCDTDQPGDLAAQVTGPSASSANRIALSLPVLA